MFKTFYPSGRVYPSDLNSMQDEYDLNYKKYKYIGSRSGANSGSTLSSGVSYIAGPFDLDQINTSTASVGSCFHLPTGFAGPNSRNPKVAVLVSFALAPTEVSTLTTTVEIGFGTVTISTNANGPIISALSSEASIQVTSISPQTYYERTIGPVTVTTTTDRAIYIKSTPSTSVSLSLLASIFYYQE